MRSWASVVLGRYVIVHTSVDARRTLAMTSRTKKYLIVTADDYGYSVERDEGIRNCYIRGAVGHVSLMVNGVSAEEAVKHGKQIGLPMGLHVNLSEGLPVTGADGFMFDGVMIGKLGFRRAAEDGRLDADELRREIQAQIDRYTELVGHKPYVVDGHQHVHIIPGVVEILAEVLRNNGIRMTRLPLEEEVASHTWSAPELTGFMAALQQNCIQAQRILNAKGIWSPGFTGCRTMSKDMSIDHLQSCITTAFSQEIAKPATPCDTSTTDDVFVPALSPVCELMSHPGNRTLQSGGCGDGPDSFSQSVDREHEMAILTSPEMADFYNRNNIEVKSFKHCLPVINK